MTEITLSDKIIIGCETPFKDNYQDTNVKICSGKKWYICDSCKIRKKLAEDIKQSIKELKEEFPKFAIGRFKRKGKDGEYYWTSGFEIIDKIFGPKLI